MCGGDKESGKRREREIGREDEKTEEGVHSIRQ